MEVLQTEGYGYNVALKNQGSDWNSQYNVEHIRGVNQELQVADDTLKAEFSVLRNANWELVNLPHNPVVENLVVVHQWQGICYYKKILHMNQESKTTTLAGVRVVPCHWQTCGSTVSMSSACRRLHAFLLTRQDYQAGKRQ